MSRASTLPTPSDAVDPSRRIDRLSALSLKRVVEPDEAVPGHVGNGQVLPTELLSIAGLGIELTPDQLNRLAREELASVADAGIRFESALTAGFSFEILRRPDLTDPRVNYILHELGEETRHSRLFVRLIGQLGPIAVNPFARHTRVVTTVLKRVVSRPALFCILVLTGEEIPDLLQKLVGEHPDADPFVRAVSRYHRQEEARHLNFARLLLPELWQAAPRTERFLVRHLAPRLIKALFDTMIHPGVYETVGLPGWKTWRAVQHAAPRVAMRHQALRPLVDAMVAAGALTPGRVPRSWRNVAGVDRDGAPQTGSAVHVVAGTVGARG